MNDKDEYIKQLEYDLVMLKVANEELLRDKKNCGTCVHFRQHYGYSNFKKEWFTINCGHCVNKTIKTRSPRRKGCENWKPIGDEDVM